MEFSTKIESSQEWQDIVKLLIKAYSADSIVKTVFRKTSTNFFFEMMLNHYAKNANLFIGKEQGEVVAVILWSDELSKPLKVSSVLRSIGIYNNLRLLVSPCLFLRIIRWNNAVERHHYHSSPHNYLCLIASKERGNGYGSTIMQAFLKDKTLPIYLENSNKEQNSGFYAKNGYRNIGTFNLFGIEYEQYLFTPTAGK